MIEPTELLRPRLLQGVSVLLAGDSSQADVARARPAAGSPAPTSAGAPARRQSPPASFGASVHSACVELGARVSVVGPIDGCSRGEEEAEMDELVAVALAELGTVEMLVLDAAFPFAAGAGGAGASSGEGGQDEARVALRRCLQVAWSVTRAVVNVALLPGERGGRIVYLAPRPLAGAHAGAACAGLENLARTLSIEWARHGITAVTIAPGESTSEQQVASLTAYLASPAGGYFSGCLLDLRGPVATAVP